MCSLTMETNLYCLIQTMATYKELLHKHLYRFYIIYNKPSIFMHELPCQT